MPKVVLECNKIWKKIGHKTIVNDLSLKLYEGDILGFIGANGAGKTTTIKLLLGLQSLNGGSVFINGFDLKKDFKNAISNVGAIVENPDLYMYMTGYDNLKIPANIYNIDDKRINEVVNLVGLENKINEKVKKYSLGMRQRLGIAQAILHKPKVLILDEPMNGLDPVGIRELKDLLLNLAKNEKIAILISSHLLSELESVCNRICVISNGVVIKDESTINIKKIADNVNYILEVGNINLDNILNNYQVIDDNHIKVKGDKFRINNILKTLLLNNILVLELKKENISLEDIFLEIERNNKNV